MVVFTMAWKTAERTAKMNCFVIDKFSKWVKKHCALNEIDYDKEF